MQIWSQDLFQSIISSGSLSATIKIVVEQPDCTITINDTVVPSGEVQVPIGSTVTYKVEKTEYNTADGSFLVVGPRTVNVSLNQRVMHTVGFKTMPTNAGITLTCSDPSYTQDGTTKSIRVPDGTTVSYTVTAPNLDSVSGTTEPIYQDYTGNNAIEVTMRAKLTINATPSTASVLLNNEPKNGGYFDCDEDVFYSVTANGYIPVGTDAQNRIYFNKPNGYLENTTLSVVLQRQVYYFSATLSTAGITEGPVIHVCVNKGDWDTIASGERIEVYAGDTVEYYATYDDVEYNRSSVTITNKNESAQILVPVTKGNVVISAVPAEATITVTEKGSGLVHTGVGIIRLDVELGTEIEFYASYAGVESERETHIVDGDFSYNISLDPQDATSTLITSDEERLFQPGRYVFVGFGGGGSGTAGKTAQVRQPSGTGSYGGHGGGGGGSGYITKIETVLLEPTTLRFVVGKGGALGVDGGATTVFSGTEVLCTADGGKATALTTDGCAGGSGGGCGSCHAWTNHRTQTYYPALNAGNGGVGGMNGETVRGKQNVDKVQHGGTGFYEEDGDLASNAGSGQTGNYGNPGFGGKGAATLLGGIPSSRELSELTLKQLYNAVEGGGGGYSSKDPGSATSLSGNWYAGPGGGGAGWFDGEDGKNTDTIISVPGKGGDGAVLYARIGWE